MKERMICITIKMISKRYKEIFNYIIGFGRQNFTNYIPEKWYSTLALDTPNLFLLSFYPNSLQTIYIYLISKEFLQYFLFKNELSIQITPFFYKEQHTLSHRDLEIIILFRYIFFGQFVATFYTEMTIHSLCLQNKVMPLVE